MNIIFNFTPPKTSYISSPMIFNIQRFSTHDGDGIRTLIFYKGCPLRCQWCSNPESQSFGYSVMYDKKYCQSFADCVKVDKKAIALIENDGIQINRDLLEDSDSLRSICATKALTVVGENKTVMDLLEEIGKDLLFYRQDGGVTLSGGEPLSQGDDLIKLLQALKKRNIKVNIETSLHVRWEKVQRCIGLVETFLVDLKHTDPVKFKTFTLGDSVLVMNNIKKLTDSKANVIIRIPVISGFNHSESEMKLMIDFVAALKNVREIHFLPFHTFGAEKYKMLGMKYLFNNEKQVRDSELNTYIEYAQLKGLRTKIGG
jgi:pyruvate formate lyase activating enzyme